MVDDAASLCDRPVGFPRLPVTPAESATTTDSSCCVRKVVLLSEKAAGCLDLPPQRRYRRAATVGAVERTGAVATCVVLYFKRKKKSVPCSSFSARPPAAFLFPSSLLQRLRAPHTDPCAKTSAVADPLRCPGAEEARLFCEGDRLRDRYECTPVFTYQQRRRHRHGDGTGGALRSGGSARLPTWSLLRLATRAGRYGTM
ncbi:hypothetical protein MTO96_010491 [Rhipicephalus appendiculatus]